MCSKLDGVRKTVLVMCLDTGHTTVCSNMTPRDALTTVALGWHHTTNAEYHSVGNKTKLIGKNDRTASLEHNDVVYSCTNLDKGE